MGGCMGKQQTITVPSTPQQVARSAVDGTTAADSAAVAVEGPANNNRTSASTPTAAAAAAVQPKPLPEPPVILLPSDPDFHPSVNGRNGFRLEDIYERGEELGRGSFFYKSMHRRAPSSGDENGEDVDWKTVAIKKRALNLLDLRGGTEIRTYDDLEQRCQEIKALIRLQKESSPRKLNVLYLYEYFWTGLSLSIVTELLGQNLDDWRTGCKVFTERMAIDCCQTILKAIGFMHSKGVVNRGIMAQSIMFRINGDVQTLKLVDFGSAQVLEGSEAATECCGSLGYVAPEVYIGEPYRFEVDLFAFGVLLFRLLSGEQPFPLSNLKILKRHTLEVRYNVQSRDWENVSAAAKSLVRKLLINRQERLTAEKALAHPWFSEEGTSVLRADLWYTGLNNGPSQALVWAQVPKSDQDENRFWSDSSFEVLLSRGICSGRMLACDEDGADVPEMIFIEEETLDGSVTLPVYLCRLRTYTENDCKCICQKLATTIQNLHEAGFAHRNLHLDNVLVDTMGNVSLRGLKHAQPILEDQPLTGQFGYRYNYYAFTAPEVHDEFVHDKSVDLFSLGAIMYVLLTGIPPFRGQGEGLANGKSSGLVEFDVIVPSKLAQSLVKGLLQVDPTVRLTIEEVFRCEWMKADDGYLEMFDLGLALEGLKYWSEERPGLGSSGDFTLTRAHNS